jgi:mannosyltransferase OCH1-like enzyme
MNYYIIGIILLIIIIFLIKIIFKVESFNNSNTKSYILLEEPNNKIKSIDIIDNPSNTLIPLNIFMTWNSSKFPPNMKKSINIIISKNSEFNFYIYSDKDCHDFLEKYFIKEVVDAFDCLIPGAYKADLWRYCILYKYGGIYQDIKFYPVNKFKYIDLINKEYFVRDTKNSGGGIYNALLICKPYNNILYKSIKQILINVKTHFYGKSCLEPTGPLLMKQFFTKNEINNLELYNGWSFINDGIYKNNIKILNFYKNYRKEQNKSTKPHYTYSYKNKNIYNC